MKTRTILAGGIGLLLTLTFFLSRPTAAPAAQREGCVFKTVFGEEPLDTSLRYAPSDKVLSSVQEGLSWLREAQQPDSGWGAGSHGRQDIRDPHAVPSDPATTAMVAMAILRAGTRPDSGPLAAELNQATEFLLKAVENTPADGANITTLTGTQIQVKLGANIDLALTAQYLSNLLTYLKPDSREHRRTMAALNKCVGSLQSKQLANGSFQGAGWAGVLQSAFANNALESARSKGAEVDKEVLERSREYQKGNFDADSKTASVIDGAGIVLYSVSGSARATAVEAREVVEVMEKAKDDGVLAPEEEVSVENLTKAGLDDDQAHKAIAAYEVYQSSKIVAQQDEVVRGFGNNGGEEFLSFLQTGESMIINRDEVWKGWFDNVSGQLLSIQNPDGSWNGHHCITSPVFCTATCVLILTVNNDIEELAAVE